MTNIYRKFASATVMAAMSFAAFEAAFTQVTLATSFSLTQSFFAPLPNTIGGQGFGNSVAISGNNLLVGAFGDDTGATNSGTAFLFNASSGNLLQTFLNPTPAEDDLFGTSLAIFGNKVLIGAPGDKSGAPNNGAGGLFNDGAAYLFDTLTGNLLQTFLKPTSPSLDSFGVSVALFGDKVLIGAPRDNTTGAVYLYDALTGNLLQTFLNPNPTPSDFNAFGASLAIDGDNVLIGSPADDTGERDSGAAYLFNASNGQLLQSFLNPNSNDPQAGIGEYFGASVAIKGDKILIGTPNDDAPLDGEQVGFDSGVAYLFDTSSGKLLETFLNPTPSNSDRFGSSVAIDGDNLLIGTRAIFDQNAAYLFDASTGKLTQTFLSPTGDSFGNSVAISGNNVLIGAIDDSTVGIASGAAFLFQRPSPPTSVPESSSVLGLIAIGALGTTLELKCKQNKHKQY